ncbi:MAG: hypothetical protein ACKVG5_07100, partial [Acidimicrobiales bacterium]
VTTQGLPLSFGSAVTSSEPEAEVEVEVVEVVEVVVDVGGDVLGVIVATTVVAAASAGDPSASPALQLIQTRSAGPRIQVALIVTVSTLPTSTPVKAWGSRSPRAHLAQAPLLQSLVQLRFAR